MNANIRNKARQQVLSTKFLYPFQLNKRLQCALDCNFVYMNYLLYFIFLIYSYWL